MQPYLRRRKVLDPQGMNGTAGVTVRFETAFCKNVRNPNRREEEPYASLSLKSP